MRSLFQTDVLGKSITARLLWAGADLAVLVSGGELPHIGSVTVAHWEKGQVILTTTQLPGHREEEITRRFAQALAEATGHTATALCGIHYDGITRAGIEAVLAAADRLLGEIMEELAAK